MILTEADSLTPTVHCLALSLNQKMQGLQLSGCNLLPREARSPVRSLAGKVRHRRDKLRSLPSSLKGIWERSASSSDGCETPVVCCLKPLSAHSPF